MEILMPSRGLHKQLSKEIHQANVDAGWWTNLVTNEKLERNFGEMVALAHSELSECWEGMALDCADDHLSDYPMYQVEIADACIRVYDILGGLFDEPYFLSFYTIQNDFTDADERLVYLHYLISQALEAFRKSRKVECFGYFYRFLDSCFTWAVDDDFDLEEVIRAKCEYNKQRADHKIENRLKENGKKI